MMIVLSVLVSDAKISTLKSPTQDENMALLSDAIEIDMTVDEIESCVGDFNVDIFASETGTDRTIIIENQLKTPITTTSES